MLIHAGCVLSFQYLKCVVQSQIITQSKYHVESMQPAEMRMLLLRAFHGIGPFLFYQLNVQLAMRPNSTKYQFVG